MNEVRFIRLPDVINRTGISRSTIYRKVHHGDFPAPVQLGQRMIAWSSFQVDEWCKKRLEGAK